MPETYGTRDIETERRPVAGAGDDLLAVRCRYCGCPVSLLYAGTVRKGRVWHARYRVIEAGGTELQRPHQCRRYARRAELIPKRNRAAGYASAHEEERIG
jgi:hypothetical protein